MFGYEPMFEYGGVEVIESETCMQTWQLNDFTKELMGAEWVKQFNAWAEHALPKQPACYMVGKDKMIVHPSVAQALRDKVKADSKFNWQTSQALNMIRKPMGVVMAGCYA
jgi:hypothetical protein